MCSRNAESCGLRKGKSKVRVDSRPLPEHVVNLQLSSQMTVVKPKNGLIFGTARSLGLEFQTNTTGLLDVESHDNKDSLDAIETGLKYLQSLHPSMLGKVDVELSRGTASSIYAA